MPEDTAASEAAAARKRGGGGGVEVERGGAAVSSWSWRGEEAVLGGKCCHIHLPLQVVVVRVSFLRRFCFGSWHHRSRFVLFFFLSVSFFLVVDTGGVESADSARLIKGLVWSMFGV